MADAKRYIAVDLGAESGRVMLGRLAAGRLELTEVQRFPTGAVEEKGSLRWDFERLLGHIMVGIGKAAAEAGGPVSGIGVDSWGVDFGLLDEGGRLIERPYHYRDRRTDGMLEAAFERMPKREIYEQTGIQFMQINTAYQLLAMRLSGAEALKRAKHLVMIADLVAHHLCGQVYCDYGLGSTSQLMDMRRGQWSEVLFEKLDLPWEIMPEVVPSGRVMGKLKRQIAAELGCEQIPVITVGSHDTACAVAAAPAPAGSDRWAYISSGTWSLVGAEVGAAIINDKTYEHQFTNEGGVDGTIRLLKNSTGLWLVQECRRQWQMEGREYSYGELARLAGAARPFAATIDPNAQAFLAPSAMADTVNAQLAATEQQEIGEPGQLVRVILESLALNYREILERLEDITGETLEVVHVVGGGIQNELLCQFTAEATGKRVVAGPVEATASGNVLMQARADGQLNSLAELREVVRNSFELRTYEPTEAGKWQEQYDKIHRP